ncbi:hypothetical protein [Elizabethkingia ursingii]
MKKSLIIALFFFGLWGKAQVQALSLGKSLLGGLSGGNQEMVAYLRSMDEKITSMEARNKNKEFREKTTPNPLVISTKLIDLTKEKAETIGIAKRVVTSIKKLDKRSIQNPDVLVNEILDISKFSVTAYVQTKKLLGYSGEAIPTQDKLKVLSDTSEMIAKNKEKLLWVERQIKSINQ